jgi:hypothetical protein
LRETCRIETERWSPATARKLGTNLTTFVQRTSIVENGVCVRNICVCVQEVCAHTGVQVESVRECGRKCVLNVREDNIVCVRQAHHERSQMFNTRPGDHDARCNLSPPSCRQLSLLRPGAKVPAGATVPQQAHEPSTTGRWQRVPAHLACPACASPSPAQRLYTVCIAQHH